MKKIFRLFFTGFAMGSADIVPGVSGGTIAFIFGIYEELVQSIKTVTGETIKLGLSFKFKDAVKSVPLAFLIPLGLGLLTALVSLAGFISHTLETSPVLIWSFFFGLIIASILIVRKRVVTWDNHDYFALVAFAIFAYILVGSVPVETPANLPAFFISGAIAIVAMILPGISGSFLLVLMGKYEQILNAVVERDVLTLGAVFLGAVIGLALFSRVLNWLFTKHHDIAVASLTGFMVGSLRKIWPWKGVGEANVIPELNADIIMPVILALIAAGIMLFLEAKGAAVEQVSDIEDREFAREHKRAVRSQKSHKI